MSEYTVYDFLYISRFMIENNLKNKIKMCLFVITAIFYFILSKAKMNEM